jgi:hypothetical protein
MKPTMIESGWQPFRRRSSRGVLVLLLTAITVSTTVSAPLSGDVPASESFSQPLLDMTPLPDPASLPDPPNPDAPPLGSVDAMQSNGPLKTAVLTTPEAEAYAPNDEYCRYSRVYRSVFLSRLWFRSEFLGWATKGQRLPALATTSPWVTPVGQAGDLDDSSTSILFGDQTIHDAMRPGGRLTVGYWWDQSQRSGIEASYFGVDGHDTRYSADGLSGQILARPYYDVVGDAGDSLLVSYPGVIDGAIDIQADMEFTGAEFLFRRMAYISPSSRVDIVAGYRYARLMDRLAIEESLYPQDVTSELLPNTFVDRRDLFQSENEFHGGQIGVIADWIGARWGFQVLGKIGLGATRAANSISGSTTTVDIGDDSLTTTAGGLLALPSNMGDFNDARFGTFSELGLSVQYYVGCQLRLSVGYTVVYWTELARAGDQVQLDVNPSQIGGVALIGPSRPRFPGRNTDFWAQGITFGFEYLF